MSRPPVGACRRCREPVIKCKTTTGKDIRVDVEPTETGRYTLSGHRPVPIASAVSAAGRYPGLRLYDDHFGTCPALRKIRALQKERVQRRPAETDQDALFSSSGDGA